MQMEEIKKSREFEEIKANGYEMCETLGGGGQGKVYKALKDGKEYAVKLLYDSDSSEFINEKDCLNDLEESDYVIKLEDYCYHDSKKLKYGYLVFPVYKETLADKMEQLKKKNPGIEEIEKEVIKIGKDLCSGLLDCHTKKIVHLDVKPENVFCDENNDEKDYAGRTDKYVIADFGIAGILDQYNIVKGCSMTYAAPEYKKAFSKSKSSEEIAAKNIEIQLKATMDIFSVGAILYEILLQKKLPEEWWTDITFKADYGKELCSIIKKCIDRDPQKRYKDIEELKGKLIKYERKSNYCGNSEDETIILGGTKKQSSENQLEENVGGRKNAPDFKVVSKTFDKVCQTVSKVVKVSKKEEKQQKCMDIERYTEVEVVNNDEL